MSPQKPSSNPDMFNRILKVLGIIASIAAIIVFLMQYRKLAYILLLVAFIIIIWPYLKKIFYRILNPKSDLTWYHVREEATPGMKKQMKESNILVFIGISQTSLDHYLRECLKESKGKVPWKSIKIFFAGDGIGRAFEQKQFEQNLRNSRQEISELLTSRAYAKKLSELTELTFRQAKQPLTYGGSMFCTNLDDIDQHEKFHTIYVVYYLPSPSLDTKKSLTLKIRSDTKLNRISDANILSNTYVESYTLLSRTAKNLGTFAPYLWDWSANEWSDFCKGYKEGMRKSMSKLIELADIKGNEHILDVAAGTGNTSLLLREKIKSGHLTILDGSPGMLNLAKKTLGSDRIDYALCYLPASEGHDVDIKDKTFDLIFCHLSLFAFARTRDNIEAFAQWCAGYLKPNGKVLLNAHNSVLKDEPDSTADNWRNWEDPFKMKLVEIAKEKGLEEEYLKYRPAENFLKPNIHRPGLLNQEDIKKAFENAGFELLKQKQDTIQIRMQDRIRMWKVPAILNTFIDIKKYGIVKAQDIVNRAGTPSIIGTPTKPRTVISWAFRKV